MFALESDQRDTVELLFVIPRESSGIRCFQPLRRCPPLPRWCAASGCVSSFSGCSSPTTSALRVHERADARLWDAMALFGAREDVADLGLKEPTYSSVWHFPILIIHSHLVQQLCFVAHSDRTASVIVSVTAGGRPLPFVFLQYPGPEFMIDITDSSSSRSPAS